MPIVGLGQHHGQFVSPQLVGSKGWNHVCKYEVPDARPLGHRAQIGHRALAIVRRRSKAARLVGSHAGMDEPPSGAKRPCARPRPVALHSGALTCCPARNDRPPIRPVNHRIPETTLPTSAEPVTRRPMRRSDHAADFDSCPMPILALGFSRPYQAPEAEYARVFETDAHRIPLRLQVLD